jgi:hypothetical protein
VTFFWDPVTLEHRFGPNNITNLNAANPNIPNFYEPITAPQPNQSTAYYENYETYIQTVGAGQPGTWSNAFNQADVAAFLPYNLHEPVLAADQCLFELRRLCDGLSAMVDRQLQRQQ